jgi:hypothetical protein
MGGYTGIRIRKYADYRIDANTEVHGCSEDRTHLLDLLSLWFVYSWKLHADARSELFIAFRFIGFLHFIKRSANERTGRLEHPLTVRAAEALKILVLNPDQLALPLQRTFALANSSSYGTGMSFFVKEDSSTTSALRWV